MNQRLQRILSTLIIGACFGAGVLITPGSSSEPVDLPKLLVINTFGFAILGILFLSSKQIFQNISHIFLALVALFTIQMTLVLILSRAPFSQQFYGTLGRNTGYLAYISLLGICVAASLVANDEFLRKFAYSFICLGIISLGYDILQTSGNDPVKWNNPYNPIIGFLGNPDFEASFLGMVGIIVVSLILRKSSKLIFKILLATLLIFVAFIIYRSAAQQGLIVLAIGSAIVLLTFLFKSPSVWIRRLAIPALIGSLIAGVIVVLGSLKIGPLGTVLYKTSVRQRGFYWNAAMNMMNNKPFTGIGLDSYGDWYFRARSTKAAIISAKVQSNAAHNVFLDLGSNGGWPLFIINIAIVILVAICGWRVIKRTSEFNWAFVGIFAAWIGFEAQSLVSINQLGIGVWGWALRGAIVGYEFKNFSSSNVKPMDKFQRKGSRRTKEQSISAPLLSMTLVGFIGFLLVFQVFQADMNYRKATLSKSAESVISAALANPREQGRMLQAAQLLASSKLFPQAIKLTDEVIKINPDSYNAIYLKLQLTPSSSSEYVNLIARLKDLDPNGKY